MHLESQMSVNTILCVKWGEKYSNDYVLNLKNQCENHCSIPFNFYCLTDNPQNSFDLKYIYTIIKKLVLTNKKNILH